MNDNFCSVPAHHQSIESTSLAKINPGVNSKRCMDNLALEAEIQKLVAEGRGSQLKQKLTVNKLEPLLRGHHRFLAGRLAGSPCLKEAWVNTLSHCFVNFWAVPEDDKLTKSAYCDSYNIVYRIRNYFQHRIKDLEMKERGATRNKEPLHVSLDAPIGQDDARTLADLLPAPEGDEDHAKLRKLVEEDVTGELRAMTMKSQPALNAQKVFLLFLERHSWRDIAAQFGVKEQTFYSFVSGSKSDPQRNCCVKLLRRLWHELYG